MSGEGYSGDGSHDPNIVIPYVNSVRWFASKLGGKLNAVDFGCGDFNVGVNIRPLFNRYVACDIAENIISRNKSKFGDSDVEFMLVDARVDDIPYGDVIFIRQVFQHLSNDVIQKIIPKLKKFKFIVFTDHVPPSTRFFPNVNIETGRLTRLVKGSGVVLTSYPFLLNPVNEYLLCALPAEGGVIKTVVYQMF